MYNPYGFYSMSKRYREEVVRDARTRHLEGRLRAERRRVDSGRGRAALAWAVWCPCSAARGRPDAARSSDEPLQGRRFAYLARRAGLGPRDTGEGSAGL